MSKPEDDGYKALEEALEELKRSPIYKKYFEEIETDAEYEEHKAWQERINARLTRLEEAVKARKDT